MSHGLSFSLHDTMINATSAKYNSLFIICIVNLPGFNFVKYVFLVLEPFVDDNTRDKDTLLNYYLNKIHLRGNVAVLCVCLHILHLFFC